MQNKVKEIVIMERVNEDGLITSRYTKARVCDEKPNKANTIPHVSMDSVLDAFEDFCKTLEWD